MKTFTLTITEDDAYDLVWLVGGNNAFGNLAERIRQQLAEQDGGYIE